MTTNRFSWEEVHAYMLSVDDRDPFVDADARKHLKLDLDYLYHIHTNRDKYITKPCAITGGDAELTDANRAIRQYERNRDAWIYHQKVGPRQVIYWTCDVCLLKQTVHVPLGGYAKDYMPTCEKQVCSDCKERLAENLIKPGFHRYVKKAHMPKHLQGAKGRVFDQWIEDANQLIRIANAIKLEVAYGYNSGSTQRNRRRQAYSKKRVEWMPTPRGKPRAT